MVAPHALVNDPEIPRRPAEFASQIEPKPFARAVEQDVRSEQPSAQPRLTHTSDESFDIVAWFAKEATEHPRRITECWYG